MDAQPLARLSVLDEQRRAVERLKSSLFGSDPYVRRRYIRDFHREFSSFRSPIGRADLLAACREADIVFVGDYHAVPACQTFAATLLEHLASQDRPPTLFLEMIFGRDQAALDQFLDGRIEEEELKRRIRYDRDWGYPWEGYGRLLDAARRARIPVVAADAPPRGGLRLIRRRDRHAATKIRERLQADPRARALVLFGESHVARSHLPQETKTELARAGLAKRAIVIVQNVEEIYWSLIRDGGDPAEAVQIDEERYCVFNASPLAKYEAYRQTLLRWSQQRDEKADYLPSVHHLIDLLIDFLGLDRYRSKASAPGGGLAPLVDLYPEVVTRRERRKGAVRSSIGRRRSPRPGVVYRPAANRIDVYVFSLAAAGEAAARFLLGALRGRAGAAAPSRRREVTPRPTARRSEDPNPSWVGVVLDELFVAFAVRFLDPAAPAFEDRRGRGAARKSRSRGRRDDLLDQFVTRVSARIRTRGRSDGSTLEKESRAVELGRRLGDAVYERGRAQEDGEGLKRWLLRVARADGSRSGSLAWGSLLRQGAAHAGWVGRETPKTMRGRRYRIGPAPRSG